MPIQFSAAAHIAGSVLAPRDEVSFSYQLMESWLTGYVRERQAVQYRNAVDAACADAE